MRELRCNVKHLSDVQVDALETTIHALAMKMDVDIPIQKVEGLLEMCAKIDKSSQENPTV